MSYIKIDTISLPATTISLCVPCIPKHVKYLNELLLSIRQQTHTPNEIIIFISEFTQEKKETLEMFLKETFPELNIIIGFTEEQQFAGLNRNNAVSFATSDIISFIDADDIMHPQRTEYILKLFSIFNVKCILHHYIQNSNFSNNEDDTFDKVDFTYQFNNLIHHGHPSFKREVFYKNNENFKMLNEIIVKDNL